MMGGSSYVPGRAGRPSSGLFDSQEERFNLLCLAEDEYYFRDHSALLQHSGGRQVAGHLKVCSLSLYFVPRDVREPIVRIPYTATTAMEDVDDEESDDWGTETSNAFCVTAKQRVCMKAGNRDVPYTKLSGSCRLLVLLVYADVDDVLPQAQELWALARSAESADKLERATAGERLRQVIDAHEAGERFNPGWLEGDERVMAELRGSRVTPLCVQPGRVVLTPRHIYFQPFNVVSSAPVQAHPLGTATAVGRRHFQLEDLGLEIFFGARTSLFLAFRTAADRDAFLAALEAQPALRLERRRSAGEWTRDWAAGHVSNYDYLMNLNRQAGRSFNDLTQYPVFPWVLADYTSAELDLTDPATFRDLSRPIAALSAQRVLHGRETFATLKSAGLPDPPWMYGSHYSNPGFVVFYLVRSNPQLMLRLQNGRFDAPDRLFCGMREAWESVTRWDSDVKELIPEFYTPADAASLLLNASGADLGVRSGGRAVGDVELPPWATDPADFVGKMVAALEGPHVSARLHKWINLVFGVKSRGKAAEAADNVFNFMTYDEIATGYLQRESDPFLLDAYRAQVREYGRTPRQLFFRKHPRRRPEPRLVRLLTACACGVPPPVAAVSMLRVSASASGPSRGRAARGGTPALRAVLKLTSPKEATREAALEWLEQVAASKEPEELTLAQGANPALEAVVAAAREARQEGGGGNDARSVLVRAAAVLVLSPSNLRPMLDAGVLEPLAQAAVALKEQPQLGTAALKAAAALSVEGDSRVAALDRALLARAAEVVAGWRPEQGTECLVAALLLVTHLCHFAAKRSFFVESGILGVLLQHIAELAGPTAANGTASSLPDCSNDDARPGSAAADASSMQSSPTHGFHGGVPSSGETFAAHDNEHRPPRTPPPLGQAVPPPSRGRRRSSAADLQRLSARKQAALALASLLHDDAQKEGLLASAAGLPTLLGLCCGEPPALQAAGWECMAVLSTVQAARHRLAAPPLFQELLRAAASGNVAVQRPAAACMASLSSDRGLALAVLVPSEAGGAEDGLAAVLKLGRSEDWEVQRHAAGALWHLMQQAQARAVLVEAGALPVLLALGASRRAVQARRLAVQALRPCAEDPALRPRLEEAAAAAGIDLEQLFDEAGALRSLSHAHSEVGTTLQQAVGEQPAISGAGTSAADSCGAAAAEQSA